MYITIYLEVIKMDLFHKRLKQLRIDKKKYESKLTQGYMADVIGVARSTYTAYENGTKQPPMETIVKLASYFEVSVDYLTGQTDAIKTDLTDKDRKNISKRLEQLKNDLEKNEGLSFYGEPLDDDAKHSILAAMQHALTITQTNNKKFIRKDYRDDN